MEVEIAYELLMTGEKEGESRVDTYYKKLKCNISTLEKSSQMWQILEKYLVNTHADTHDFRLDIENVRSYVKLLCTFLFMFSIGNFIYS